MVLYSDTLVDVVCGNSGRLYDCSVEDFLNDDGTIDLFSVPDNNYVVDSDVYIDSTSIKNRLLEGVNFLILHYSDLRNGNASRENYTYIDPLVYKDMLFIGNEFKLSVIMSYKCMFHGKKTDVFLVISSFAFEDLEHLLDNIDDVAHIDLRIPVDISSGFRLEFNGYSAYVGAQRTPLFYSLPEAAQLEVKRAIVTMCNILCRVHRNLFVGDFVIKTMFQKDLYKVELEVGLYDTKEDDYYLDRLFNTNWNGCTFQTFGDHCVGKRIYLRTQIALKYEFPKD